MKIKQQDLEKSIKVYNVDGTQNKQGTIKKYVELDVEIHRRKRKQRLLVTGLGKQKIILGFTWLKEMNLMIDWRKGTLEWRERKSVEQTKTVEYYEYLQNLLKEPILKKVHTTQPVTIEDEEDQERSLNQTQNPLDDNEVAVLISAISNLDNDERHEQLIASMTNGTNEDIWIHAKMNKATEIQVEINQKKKILPLEEQIPKEFHEYLDVFSEERAARFPESRTWDHKIEMKESFTPKSFKTYNLTPEEQIELDKFLKDNLNKGYIRPSQSPMASPFFFVKKKDGKL